MRCTVTTSATQTTRQHTGGSRTHIDAASQSGCVLMFSRSSSSDTTLSACLCRHHSLTESPRRLRVHATHVQHLVLSYTTPVSEWASAVTRSVPAQPTRHDSSYTQTHSSAASAGRRDTARHATPHCSAAPPRHTRHHRARRDSSATYNAMHTAFKRSPMPPHTTPAPHDALCREIAHRDVASMTGGGISSATHTDAAASAMVVVSSRYRAAATTLRRHRHPLSATRVCSHEPRPCAAHTRHRER
jgi:hypothetical protein